MIKVKNLSHIEEILFKILYPNITVMIWDIVSGRLIQPKEAHEMAQNKYEELKQVLMQFNTSIISTDMDEEEKPIITKLNNIQDIIESVKEEIKSAGDVIDLDTDGLNERLMAILELFDSLYSDIRFRTPLVFTETQIVLAHSRVSWIADAQGIIRDPKSARHGKGFTFDGERDRLATEFQARFPKFAGYRVTAKRRGFATDFALIDGPPEPDTGIISTREILSNELVEFLKWELRKISDDMIFKIFISGGKRKLFSCNVKVYEP